MEYDPVLGTTVDNAYKVTRAKKQQQAEAKKLDELEAYDRKLRFDSGLTSLINDASPEEIAKAKSDEAIERNKKLRSLQEKYPANPDAVERIYQQYVDSRGEDKWIENLSG